MEIIFCIIFLIALSATILASKFDIKTTEIPDYITYSLITLGITINLILSIQLNSFNYIIYSISAVIIVYAFGFIMDKLKQWGGGDAKLMTGIAALLAPFNSFLLKFIIVYFIAGVLLWIIPYSIYKIITNYKIFKKEIKKEIKSFKKPIIILIFLSTTLSILFFLKYSLTFQIIPLLIILYLILHTSIKTIDKEIMTKEIKLNQIIEGDWLAEDVKKEDKLILKKSTPGLEKKHIEILKKNNIETIKVKYGVPFAPVFAISLILTLILQNLLQ